MTQQIRTEGIQLAGSLVLLGAILFLWQAFMFTHELRPDEADDLRIFLQFISGMPFGLTAEMWARTCLFLFNLGFLVVLYSVGLVEKRALAFVAIWPMSIFLFSKIYWEFFCFPLCFVRTDLRFKTEQKFIAFLSILLLLTGEANLGVLLIFRCAIALHNLGLKRITALGLVISGLVMDVAMRTGVAFSIPFAGGLLQRFNWTRNIVNPDYSPFESIAVFAASFHFFSLHTGAYWIDAIFSIAISLILFSSRAFRVNLAMHFWLVACFFAVYFFFTNVTYAFQNARYYYFYIAILPVLVPRNLYITLGIMSGLHVIIRSFEFL